MATELESCNFTVNQVVEALRKGEEYREGLLDRAPAKMGDLVELTKAPEITEEKSRGWLCWKHVLIAGAKGIVSDMNFYDGKFWFGVRFHEQSCIDEYTGEVHMIENRGTFMFPEEFIRKIDMGMK